MPSYTQPGWEEPISELLRRWQLVVELPRMRIRELTQGIEFQAFADRIARERSFVPHI